MNNQSSPLELGSSSNEVLTDLNIESPLSNISDLSINQQLVPVNQWISGIQNSAEIRRYAPENMNYLNSILGPIAVDVKESYIRLDNELMDVLSQFNDEHQGGSLQEIILKVNKKVFIESIDFYQKATNMPSSIMKIQLKRENKSTIAEWIEVYRALIPIPVQSLLQLFSPKLLATSFKTDSIKISLLGDVKMLDAIHVKGSLYSNDMEEAKKKEKPSDPLGEYSLLPRQLHSLISSDLFSDIVFEVEGKKVPAHRNILAYRSEYFRAMLSEKSKFAEATQRPSNLIYMGDITYDVFLQVLNFIYTGHVDLTKFSHCIAIELMRVSYKMNLRELEKLCLFHLSRIINRDNACKMYKECHEKEPIVESAVQICHDEIIVKFSYISKTEDFCSLPQELMIKLVENVIPRLARVNSVQVNEFERNEFVDMERPPALQISSSEENTQELLE